MTAQTGVVYILRLSLPLGNSKHSAQYYIGWCKSTQITRRLKQHQKGKGAAFTKAAVAKGLTIELVCYYPNKTREFERELKNKKNTPRLVATLKRQNKIHPWGYVRQ